MYKYFKELEKPKEFISYLGLPIDYYDFKSYYDDLWDKTMHLTTDSTVIYNWSNAWYITPNGYLYNTIKKET